MVKDIGAYNLGLFQIIHAVQNYGKEVKLKDLAPPVDKIVNEQEIFFKKNILAPQGNFASNLFLSSSNLEIEHVLQNFKDNFQEPRELPPLRSYNHMIPLQNRSGLVCVRPFRYPHFQKNEIERLVANMLKSGLIFSSQSSYSSPVLLVKKHDGSWRLCIDYRALNQITIKDKFPILVIDELLDELHGAKYFTKLDLRSGNHQIRMHPKDISKTTFQTHQGHYEFLVMSPSMFQSLMNDVFKECLHKFILVFFDDILIYSKTWADHLEHLHIALSILRANKLFVKKEKCSFGQEEVKYLGHIISIDGVVVDPKKVAAILNWPKLATIKVLRGFLGLTGYSRKFIQNYGKITRSLTDMLKKGNFKWNLKAEASFEQLKMVMTQAPVLALPNFDELFIVECDATRSGIGGVLMQNQRPIAFFSHALRDKNLFFSTYEKEMLALVLAVQKWRPYLLGRKFVVRTDQKSLKHLWKQKITTTAQEKWLVKLMGYNFTIDYKKGKDNVVADALSRGEEDGEINAISALVPHWLKSIREEV